MGKTQIRSAKPYIPALYFILTGLEGLGILAWLNYKSAIVTRPESWVAAKSIKLISLGWLILASALVIFGLFLLLRNKSAQNFYNRMGSALVGDYPRLRRLLLILCVAFLLLTTAMILIWGANNAVIKYFTEPMSIWIYLGIIQFLFLVIFFFFFQFGMGIKKFFLFCLAGFVPFCLFLLFFWFVLILIAVY